MIGITTIKLDILKDGVLPPSILLGAAVSLTCVILNSFKQVRGSQWHLEEGPVKHHVDLCRITTFTKLCTKACSIQSTISLLGYVLSWIWSPSAWMAPTPTQGRPWAAFAVVVPGTKGVIRGYLRTWASRRNPWLNSSTHQAASDIKATWIPGEPYLFLMLQFKLVFEA